MSSHLTGGTSFNTAIGASALRNTTGISNTGAGYLALYWNDTGSNNTATGDSALFKNTTGNYNTATGAYTLTSNTTGGYNTASGYSALSANTTGGSNVAIGGNAMLYNVNGSYNAAVGEAALYKNTSGAANVASGGYALYANTTGNYNTALGYNALTANTFGANNVAVGQNALYQLAGGSNNVAIGTGAGKWTKTGSGNIYIGHFGISTGNESHVTRIGQTQTKAYIAGIKGVPLKGATVVVNSAGQLGVVASSARYKTNIKSLGDISSRLAQLRPVSYEYKSEPGPMHYGLIAEEVDKVMPELVVRDEENRPESVQYQELIPLLLKDRQELRAELAKQRALVDRQQRHLDRQDKELAEVRRMLTTRIATRGGFAAQGTE